MRLLLLAAMLFCASAQARTCLSESTDYYVASAGSDQNDGSIVSPWATPTYAYSWIQRNIDACGQNIAIHLSGTGCQPFTVTGQIVGIVSPASITFLGDAIDPENCRIVGSGSAVQLLENAAVQLNGLHISSITGNSITVSDSRLYLAGVWFGQAGWAHIQALGNMTHVSWVSGNVIIIGNAPYGFLAEDKAQINLNRATINYFWWVTYQYEFAHADQAAVIDFTDARFIYNTYQVFGRQFFSEQGALIRTGGNVLPGSIPGVTETYGLVM